MDIIRETHYNYNINTNECNNVHFAEVSNFNGECIY